MDIINILIIIGVLICISILIYMVRSSRIKDLDKFFEETYIISDPGDEVEHIYSDDE